MPSELTVHSDLLTHSKRFLFRRGDAHVFHKISILFKKLILFLSICFQNNRRQKSRAEGGGGNRCEAVRAGYERVAQQSKARIRLNLHVRNEIHARTDYISIKTTTSYCTKNSIRNLTSHIFLVDMLYQMFHLEVFKKSKAASKNAMDESL